MSILPSYHLDGLKGFTYPLWSCVLPVPPFEAPAGDEATTIDVAMKSEAATTLMRVPSKTVSFVGLRG
jgi:hypothetical protein